MRILFPCCSLLIFFGQILYHLNITLFPHIFYDICICIDLYGFLLPMGLVFFYFPGSEDHFCYVFFCFKFTKCIHSSFCMMAVVFSSHFYNPTFGLKQNVGLFPIILLRLSIFLKNFLSFLFMEALSGYCLLLGTEYYIQFILDCLNLAL